MVVQPLRCTSIVTMDVTPEEVVAFMQSRFPKELEIAVLAIQNQKAMQQLAELAAVDAEDTAE